jgi:hypothetical protein
MCGRAVRATMLVPDRLQRLSRAEASISNYAKSHGPKRLLPPSSLTPARPVHLWSQHVRTVLPVV